MELELARIKATYPPEKVRLSLVVLDDTDAIAYDH